MNKYIPLDYSNWDFKGKGKNILSLLNPKEKEIWNLALPYQDKRKDKGHAETVSYFAFKLLDFFNAKREIVIPAAILHDIGWSQIFPLELRLFNFIWGKKDYDLIEDYYPVLIQRHEKKGVELAEKILNKVNYNHKLSQKILKIISQHDSGKKFISSEDELTRNSDRLWRYTYQAFLADKKRFNWSIDDYKKMQEPSITQKDFFSDKIKKIANREFGNVFLVYKNGKFKIR